MEISEVFNSQLYSSLLNLSHPLEGTFYLFLLAVIFRWRWPKTWNRFLKSVAAKGEGKLNDHK